MSQRLVRSAVRVILYGIVVGLVMTGVRALAAPADNAQITIHTNKMDFSLKWVDLPAENDKAPRSRFGGISYSASRAAFLYMDQFGKLFSVNAVGTVKEISGLPPHPYDYLAFVEKVPGSDLWADRLGIRDFYFNDLTSDAYILISAPGEGARCHFVTVLTAQLGGAGPWRELWKTRCWDFGGSGSIGGALAVSGNALFISMGDNELTWHIAGEKIKPTYPAVLEAEAMARYEDYDVGQIFKLDMQTGTSTEFARGFRNPQGMVVDKAGRLVAVDHGPQGGDEINYVQEGHHYGWPYASHGVGYQEDTWRYAEFAPDGFETTQTDPLYAWVPSIAPSDVEYLPENGFDFWPRGYELMLVSTLRNASLVLVTMDPDDLRVISTEEFRIGARLRDVAVASDGSGVIAVTTDGTGQIGLLTPIAN